MKGSEVRFGSIPSAGEQYCMGVKESERRRDGCPEDMNGGSLYLASMGVRKGKRDMLGREWRYLTIDRMIRE